MMHPEKDLLGYPIAKPAAPRKPPVHGYAARTGTGPKGQRCNTCNHCMVVTSRGARSRKCELMAARWTHDTSSDVKHNAPACKHWQRKKYEDPSA